VDLPGDEQLSKARCSGRSTPMREVKFNQAFQQVIGA
jgi:hypothetical protein